MDNFEEVYKPEFDKHDYSYQLNYRNDKDAVLVGYNKNKFKLVDKMPINFNDIGEVHNWSKDFRKCNQALLCLLEHIDSGQKLIVVSTHFHWNSELDYVKYAQGVWLLKSISEFLKKNQLSVGEENEEKDDFFSSSNIPLIVSGDFNSEPSSTLLHLMNDQKVNTENLEEFTKLAGTYNQEESREQFALVNSVFKTL